MTNAAKSKSERGLVSEAQHRIASAPITLIKKGTLPPGTLPYWAVPDVPFFRVSFFSEKIGKKILNRVGGGGLDTSFITIFSSFGRI